jgi:hypothetical protein
MLSHLRTGARICSKLSSELPSALSVKVSPNLTTFTQEVSYLGAQIV